MGGSSGVTLDELLALPPSKCWLGASAYGLMLLQP